MSEVLVCVVDNCFVGPRILSHELCSLRPVAQRARRVLINRKPVSLRPVIHIGDNVGEVIFPARVQAASVIRRAVLEAVKLHQRNGKAAGIAWRELLRRAVEVECSGYGGKSGDPSGCDGVACEKAGEAAAIGLSGCVDAGGVDAEG